MGIFNKKSQTYLILSFLLLFNSCSSIPVVDTTAERIPTSASAYKLSCVEMVSEIISSRNFAKSITVPTQIEKKLSELGSTGTLDVQLQNALDELQKLNPELAKKVIVAINKKKTKGASALEIDLSQLPQKMVNFLEGPFEKIVGLRGLSEPFVKIEMIDANTLFVFHEGDKYPFIIRWDDVMSPKVELIASKDLKLTNFKDNSGATAFQVLSIPYSMTNKEQLGFLNNETRSLITGSQMNRYISSERSLTMKIAAILHDNQLVFDRPTQAEFLAIRQRLNTDNEFRKAFRSLLFVAPTATGKTRILGANVINKIKQVNSLLVKNAKYPKKLSVVMANTPDLVNQLAQDIGRHLKAEIVPANFRMIQWGGLLSEDMSLVELMKFIEKSDVPVVLVTSSQTIASRVKSDQEITTLFKTANSLSIDEAHNSSSNTFKRVMNAGLQVAASDRKSGDVSDAMDILGVTASPLTRTERTVEVFDRSYWVSIDTPSTFAKKVKDSVDAERSSTAADVLEYVRIQQQFQNARLRGEITAPESPLYFNPKDFGHKFDTIFGRGASGTQPNVSIDKLKEIWPTIFPMIDNHGRGVIQTYPRDADNVAETLSKLTGKNYVSLNLSETKRDAVLNAFKQGTLYNGKPVDAIVGKIKEGLDFPDAGWFLSFIRYVRFPGNIQAQGRVVRLSPNKVTPPIIYFGESVDSIAFKDVRDLIFNKMGRLPRKLEDSRGFSGARNYLKTHPNSSLGKSIPEVNTAIEVLFRQNNTLAKQFAGDAPVDPEAVLKLQKTLSEILRSRGNHEIAAAVKQFMNQAHAYKFSRETLEETWKYCDVLLKAKTKGAPYPKSITPEDIKILDDAQEMENVAEFRAMRSWLSGFSREILQNMKLSSRGVYDLADTLNVFVERYGDNALAAVNDWTFKNELSQTLSVSSSTLWSRLSYRARTTFDSYFRVAEEKSIEENLNEYVMTHKKLPDFFFGKLEEGKEILLDDKSSHRLAERLQSFIQTGELDLTKLDKDFLDELDSSPLFARIVGQAVSALQEQLLKVKSEVGEKEFKAIKLTYEDLTRHKVFGSLKIVEELAEMNYPNSRQIKKSIEEILNSK